MRYRKILGLRRKKRYNNRRRNRNYKHREHRSSLVSVRGPSGLPDRLRVKLKYADVYPLITSAAQIYRFKGNGLVDPDDTGTGHQPYMFDQWAAMYDRYRVYGSSILVDAINVSATVAAQLVVYPTAANSTTANTIAEASEIPRSVRTYLMPVASRFPVRVKRYVSTRSIEGLARGTVEIDDTYASVSTTNPNNLWYWNVVAESLDLTTTLNMYFTVKIMYYVEFYSPTIQVQS